MALYRNARIVADFLTRAGERIEECALAGIRAADKGDEGQRVHLGSGIIRTAAACLRRIATVIRPIRTVRGLTTEGADVKGLNNCAPHRIRNGLGRRNSRSVEHVRVN